MSPTPARRCAPIAERAIASKATRKRATEPRRRTSTPACRRARTRVHRRARARHRAVLGRRRDPLRAADRQPARAPDERGADRRPRAAVVRAGVRADARRRPHHRQPGGARPASRLRERRRLGVGAARGRATRTRVRAAEHVEIGARSVVRAHSAAHRLPRRSALRIADRCAPARPARHAAARHALRCARQPRRRTGGASRRRRCSSPTQPTSRAAMRALDLDRANDRSQSCAPAPSSGPAKRWPAEHFADARTAPRRATAMRSGSWARPTTRRSAAALVAGAADQPRCAVRDLTGRTDLGTAIDLMSVASIVVSNDSGLMHAAAAVRAPLVALFGSSSPVYTPPLSDNGAHRAHRHRVQPLLQARMPARTFSLHARSRRRSWSTIWRAHHRSRTAPPLPADRSAMPKARTPPIYTSPQDVAQAFYQAFEARDIDAMMATWAEDEDIVCIHPGGMRHVGYESVRHSFEQLFAGEHQAHVPPRPGRVARNGRTRDAKRDRASARRRGRRARRRGRHQCPDAHAVRLAHRLPSRVAGAADCRTRRRPGPLH